MCFPHDIRRGFFHANWNSWFSARHTTYFPECLIRKDPVRKLKKFKKKKLGSVKKCSQVERRLPSEASLPEKELAYSSCSKKQKPPICSFLYTIENNGGQLRSIDAQLPDAPPPKKRRPTNLRFVLSCIDSVRVTAAVGQLCNSSTPSIICALLYREREKPPSICSLLCVPPEYVKQTHQSGRHRS